MTINELREKYLKFFKERGHAIIPSASLIPENDPSVLFTTAGMHPLVPYLLGEEHPSGTRLVNVQKCIRTGDIDEVGDGTHLTFFEMLGNWSLGDYFKEDAIRWSFEFLTSPEWLNIPINRLAVSVFAGDQNAPCDNESATIWKEVRIPEERIAYLDKSENWWPAGGKHPGPQGPDTEMFYWIGNEAAPDKFDPKDSRWVEIWNDVFIQFNKTSGGELELLIKKNVDTGMGLERLVAALQGKSSIFETDIFVPIIKKIEEVSSAEYTPNKDLGRSMRIIADHLRASVFIIGDRFGVTPSNVDQGYVLRRLIRRSIRHGKMLHIEHNFTKRVARVVIDLFEDTYPELKEREDIILIELEREENRFRRTLAKGEKQFEKMFKKEGEITGEVAFDLYATYGFPIELTEEMAEEKGQNVDKEIFKAEFKKHQDLSRAGATQKFTGGLADDSEDTVKLHTATHLLLQALREVLGDNVSQKGANITAKRLRLDFSHPEKLTNEQKKKVEEIVNDAINKKLDVHFEILDISEAKKMGAIGVFDDKYVKLGGQVKVYFVGSKATEDYLSKEVCGGPHITNTGDLGVFKIKKEESVGAGIRRIKAVLE